MDPDIVVLWLVIVLVVLELPLKIGLLALLLWGIGQIFKRR